MHICRFVYVLICISQFEHLKSSFELFDFLLKWKLKIEFSHFCSTASASALYESMKYELVILYKVLEFRSDFIFYINISTIIIKLDTYIQLICFCSAMIIKSTISSVSYVNTLKKGIFTLHFELFIISYNHYKRLVVKYFRCKVWLQLQYSIEIWFAFLIFSWMTEPIFMFDILLNMKRIISWIFRIFHFSIKKFSCLHIRNHFLYLRKITKHNFMIIFRKLKNYLTKIWCNKVNFYLYLLLLKWGLQKHYHIHYISPPISFT